MGFVPNGDATEQLFPHPDGGNCMKVMFSQNPEWPIREAYFHLLRSPVLHRLGEAHRDQGNMASEAYLDGGALVGHHPNKVSFVHLGFYECDDSGGGTPLASGVLSTFRPQNVPGKIKFEGGEYKTGAGRPQKLMEVQLRSRTKHTRPDPNYPWNG